MMLRPRAAGVLFIADGKILLLKRQGAGDFPNTWGLPFGKIEIGESPLQAAMRETLEETGHAITGEIEPFSDDQGCITFAAQCAEFVPVLNDEHSEYTWADLDTLPSPLHPSLGGLNEFADVMDLDDTARQFDFNGWLTIRANPISKAGVFPYLGKRIPGAPESDKIYYVYRPAEELADPECIESFRLLPWIDNHQMLGSEETGNMPAERKGVHGVIGETVFFEGDTLYANLKVFSEALADLIDSGKTELSAGYRAKYEYNPGIYNGMPYDYVQRCLRGNHLASVDRGRMGPAVAVMDYMEFKLNTDTIMTNKDIAKLQSLMMAHKVRITKHTAAMDADDDASKSDPPPKPTEGEPGENPNKTDDDATDAANVGAKMTVEEAVQAFEAMMPLLEKLIAAAQLQDKTVDDADADTPAMPLVDAMDAADKPRRTGAKPMDFKSFARQLSQRDELAKRLSDHIGVFDHADWDIQEVAAYGAEKLELNVPKGQELGAVNGWLSAAAKKPAVQRHVATMDAADSDNAVTRYINGK